MTSSPNFAEERVQSYLADKEGDLDLITGFISLSGVLLAIIERFENDPTGQGRDMRQTLQKNALTNS